MEKREKSRITEILYYYKKILETRGFKVIYIGLYGSQNYNVSDERSDIDAKAIVLPTLANIIHRKVISEVIETKYGSIDCKDIITFNEVIRKGNFSYIEAVQSVYNIGDTDIVNKLFGDIQVNLKSIIGGMLEKRKALTHKYPSKVAEFEQFGCDPKQFHHIWRLSDLLNYILSTGENRAFLRYNRKQRNFMINLKRKMVFSLKETELLADYIIENAKNSLNERYPQYKYEPIDNTEILDNYIEEEIRKQLIKKD